MANEIMIFHNPTARELAAYFASLPVETKVVIKDADTGWLMGRINIKRIDDNTIALKVRYHEMKNKKESDFEKDRSN